MRLPLFPLHTVLAPGVVLSLHVFEERYRLLIRRCLDASSPFGVVLIREGPEVLPPDGQPTELSIASVGTFAEIREASRYPDGRWDVQVVGTGRFDVASVDTDGEPYLVAEVVRRPELEGDADEAEILVDRVRRRFVDYLRLIQPRDGELGIPLDVQVEIEVGDADDDDDDDDPDDGADDGDEFDEASLAALTDAPDSVAMTLEALRIPDDPIALSYLLTGIVQAEPDRKQMLLEAPTAEQRLRDLDELLDRELDLLERRLALYIPDRRTFAQQRN
jgi:Lon protease-like protein